MWMGSDCIMVFILYLNMRFYWANIATLGSILDTQLSWESSKFQLARWSHEVAILSHQTTPTPTPTPPPTILVFSSLILCGVPILVWTQVHVRCPPLILSSMWCYVRCPHPSINIWTQFLVRCPHPHINPRIIPCLSWYSQVECQSSLTCILECATPGSACFWTFF